MIEVNEKPGGLYIHIPFCAKKCRYCDFYSTTDLAKSNLFLTALEREMALARQIAPVCDTLYIGGGTPSVLDAAALSRMIDRALRHFSIRYGAEITIEVNPATVTLEDFRRYRQTGVNRLSIGIQSFSDKNLRCLGRMHSSGQGLSCIEQARRAGFDNIGLDLIYGLPGQDQANWLTDLSRAVQIGAEHLSCYLLTRESGTPLDMEILKGRIHLPAEAEVRSLFETTSEYLTTHGYFHYEVSNFARQADDDGCDWKSRHNQKYWTFEPYIGLGPSAHSFLAPKRHWNHRHLDQYLEDLRQGKLPISGKENLTQEQMIIEAVYLGFRTAAGINFSEFEQRFGINFHNTFQATIADFEEDKLIKVNGHNCVVTPKGMPLVDSITAAFTLQDLPIGSGQKTDDG